MKNKTTFSASLTFTFVLFIILNSFGQTPTKTAIANGRWSTASVWSPSGVPTATDNVLIPNGRTVSIRSNAACNSLTVGTGASGMLEFRRNTASILTVSNNITINPNGTFRVRNTSNTTHTLAVSGNIINNGTLDFAIDANSFCHANFLRNGNQTISGTGTLTRFYLMQLKLLLKNLKTIFLLQE